MKKCLFFLSIFAVALWSCTDKNELGADNQPDRDLGANYLSVSIVPAMETGTRADDESGNYRDGNEVENYVKNVRFYFFDANGQAQNVKRDVTTGEWTSYYDVVTPEVGDREDENVEKVINAIVVLESPNGDQVPASVAVIVNYDSSLFGGDLEVTSISDLLSKTGAFSKPSYAEKEGILMSSTVYKQNNGTQVVELKLKPEDFKRSAADAKLNPVTIYVERAVAKVSFNVSKEIEGAIDVTDDDAAGGKIFPLWETITGGEDQTSRDQELKINGEQIYVKFFGWNVTQTADKSFAVKNLESAWTYDGQTAPFVGWTHPGYYRSYWALNPSGITFNYTDFDGTNEENLPAGNKIKGISDNSTVVNYTYVHENAPQTVDAKRTEVLVAAQLVDKSGKAIELADFNGFKYMGKNYSADVLKAAANMINVWKKTVNGSETTYTSIENELQLVSARAAGQYEDFGTGSYYTYVQLKEEVMDDLASGKYTFVDNDDENGEVIDYEALNEKLLKLPYLKVWTEGNTYYYVDIEHLNKAAETTENYPVGKYGVVRNHWYAIDVTKVYGLGTPVFNPYEKIIPEDPTGHESYLAAKININSWRLVKQGTTLGQR